MHNSAMPNTNNEMSYYDSDFEVFHRWGSCDECGDATNEYEDDINDDNTPHGGVLILDENEGDDYKQLSFDLGEEDIRNKPSNQPAHQIRTLSIPEFAADFDLCRCGGSISESSFESWGFVDNSLLIEEDLLAVQEGFSPNMALFMAIKMLSTMKYVLKREGL